MVNTVNWIEITINTIEAIYMVNILILNTGTSNKGNRALIYSVTKIMNDNLPMSSFSFMGPEETYYDGTFIKMQLGWGFSIKKPFNVISSIFYIIYCTLLNTIKKFKGNFKLNPNNRLFDYWNADIVINSGGDSLSGEYGIGTLGSFFNILYAIILDKPIILFGESLGYFNNRFLDSFAKFILEKTDLIIVRERLSEDYLIKNDIKQPKIVLAADPAFILPYDSPEHVNEILLNENVHLTDKVIGINPSGLISFFMGADKEIAERQMVNIFSKISDELVKELDVSIILIPHVYTPGVDDRTIIDKIFNNCKFKNRIYAIKQEYTPQELKGIIKFCNIFIGARMHATIASTSMCIPTIGIAYSHKMHGIIGDMLGLEEYVIDIQDIDYDYLLTKILDLWKNQESIKAHLVTINPSIKEKANQSGLAIRQLIEEKYKYVLET